MSGALISNRPRRLLRIDRPSVKPLERLERFELQGDCEWDRIAKMKQVVNCMWKMQLRTTANVTAADAVRNSNDLIVIWILERTRYQVDVEAARIKTTLASIAKTCKVGILTLTLMNAIPS